MKISLFLKCTLLTLLICCFSAASQDYTHLGLPDGAIARLGKGELGQIHFSPDGSVLAVSSSVGIWFHNPQTGKELSLKCHRLFRPKISKVKRRFVVEIL